MSSLYGGQEFCFFEIYRMEFVDDIKKLVHLMFCERSREGERTKTTVVHFGSRLDMVSQDEELDASMIALHAYLAASMR